MLLLPPLVIGPLSECSNSIEVQGQVTGTTVKIFADPGRLLAQGIARGPIQSFPLIPGQRLIAGEHISATQNDSSGVSEHTPEPRVVVQAKPSVPGHLAFKIPPKECAKVLSITGAVPGAVVEAQIGGKAVGVGTAEHGEAQVILRSKLALGDRLTVKQNACGVDGPGTPAPRIAALPDVIPPPLVVAPVECQKSIKLLNLVPGAIVITDRGGGIKPAALCTEPSMTMFVATPFKLGETITAILDLSPCRTSIPSPSVKVDKADGIPSPNVMGPICGGANSVALSSLRVGALVTIFVDGDELGNAEAPQETFLFPLPINLRGKARVSARQALCGKGSGVSNIMEVESLGKDLPVPTVSWPLYDCAGTVRVTNIIPGSRISLNSKLLMGEIANTVVYGREADIAVSPLLIEGDLITAVAYSCGGSKDGGPDKVKAAPELLPPSIGDVTVGMSAVKVRGIIPGAMVDVYVDGNWQGSDFIGADTGEVPILNPLGVGNRIAASQRLCSMISDLTKPEVIVDAPPVASFTATPTAGEAPLEVKFTDASIGRISSREWDFENRGKIDSSVVNPSYTYNTSGKYDAKLKVTGAGGHSTTTVPINVMPNLPGFDQVAIENCNTAVYEGTFDHRSVTVWIRDLTAGGPWISKGTLNAQYDSLGSCPATGAPIVIDLIDTHSYEIAGVDQHNVGCSGDNPSELNCRRLYFQIRGKKGGGRAVATVDGRRP